ncbi:MAG: carboxypeptidase regulatory-like domain-containing protein, partial [Acidimicrobiales bacterium]
MSAPTAPSTSPSPGQPVTATFQVTNTGSGTATAPWNDSVYVGTSTTYNSSDVLLERIPHTSSVGPGDSYNVTVNGYLPPLPAGGNYRLFVVPDSGGRVSDPTADTQAVSPPFTVSPPPDLGNGAVSTTVAAGQNLYVQVSVGDSADTQVSVNQQGVDLLASPGVFPTEISSKEQASGSAGPATLILPESTPGVWYIDLHGEDSAGAPPGDSVTVTAATIGLTVTHVEPTSGSILSSSSVIALQGSDFGSDTTVTLSRLGANLSAYSVDVVNSTLLYASFQLDLIAPAVYDIVVTSHGRTTTLSSAYTVTQDVINQVQVTATGPDAVRFGWPGVLAVTVKNIGDSDVTVPIVRVTASVLGEVAVPGSTDYGQSADLVNPDFSSKATGPLPPSVLPPGDAATFLFPVGATQDEGDADMFYSAQAVTSADPTPIDWTAQLASGQPTGVSAATWTAVTNDISNQMGSTEGSYAAALPVVFAEAAGYGITFSSEDQILGYLIHRALATAPGAAVSGTLYLGNTSTPLAQTNISLADATGEPQYSTISWYNGQFNVWDVAAGSYSLTADGYTPRPALSVTSPTPSPVSVVVQAGATLSGTITRTDNSDPVSGAEVTATDADGTLVSDLTGADGSYQIAGLETGNVTVTVSATGLAESSSTVSVDAPSTTTDNIALQPGATVAGTITVPGGGNPPTGTLISASPAGGGDPSDGVLDNSGDGAYSIGGLSPGDYTITASAPGFGDATASVTIVGNTPINGEDLTLSTSGVVSGVVTDADTGLPIAGASVSSGSMSTIAPVTTGADGSFSLGGLTAGSDLLLVSPPDDTHIVGEATVQVSSSEPATADVALQPSGSMSATIEDGSGNPLAGVQTTLLGPGFTGAPNAIQSTPITSGNDGVATATDLPPGSYDLQVEGSTVDHPFTIESGTRNPTFTVIVPVAEVAGSVEAGGTGVAGVPVDLLVNGQSVAGTTTSADGSYQFSVTRGGPISVLAASNAVGVVSAGGLTATLGSTTEVPTLQA